MRSTPSPSPAAAAPAAPPRLQLRPPPKMMDDLRRGWNCLDLSGGMALCDLVMRFEARYGEDTTRRALAAFAADAVQAFAADGCENRHVQAARETLVEWSKRGGTAGESGRLSSAESLLNRADDAWDKATRVPGMARSSQDGNTPEVRALRAMAAALRLTVVGPEPANALWRGALGSCVNALHRMEGSGNAVVWERLRRHVPIPPACIHEVNLEEYARLGPDRYWQAHPEVVAS